MGIREIRLKLINHPNPQKIIIDNFSDVYTWNYGEEEYWNVIDFFEVVRVNKLWDNLENILK